jgi:hypothetical protein
VKTVRNTLCLSFLLLASCASDKGADSTTTAASSSGRVRSIDDWVADTSRDNGGGYRQDSKGNWKSNSNKRSSFESQGDSPYFKGDYGSKEYKTGEYTKKSWWGNKDYQPKQYAGNTDGSRFQQKSRLDGQGARESGSAAKLPDPYQTDAYATGSALEAGNSPIGKPSDAETDNRRKAYQQPDVIDWREQRAMTLQQSKGILGR